MENNGIIFNFNVTITRGVTIMTNNRHKENLKVDVRRNKSKTNVMFQCKILKTIIRLENDELEEVQEYNYLEKL